MLREMEKAAEQAAKDTPAVRAEVSRIGKERHAAEMKKVSLKTSKSLCTQDCYQYLILTSLFCTGNQENSGS